MGVASPIEKPFLQMGMMNRISTFEEYMLLDDTAAFPMDSFRRLRFAGRLDRSLLQKALEIVVRRHPLMQSKIVQKNSGHEHGFFWSRVHTPTPIVFHTITSTEPCNDENDPLIPLIRPIQLFRGAGLRLYVLEQRLVSGEIRTEILFQVHHCCSDGVGILQFIRDVLLTYHHLWNTQSSTQERSLERFSEEDHMADSTTDAAILPPLESEQLGIRDYFGISWRRYFRQAICGGLSGLIHFLGRKTQPLLPHRVPSCQIPVCPYPTFLHFELNTAETTAYCQAAKLQGVTVNDLMLRDFFLAIGRLRRQYLSQQDNGWLRVSVPMNMRQSFHTAVSAANITSMVFLDRCASQLQNSTSLLMNIHREMRRIKRNDLGLSLILNLRASRFLPGGLKRELKRQRCRATAVLSNLGKIWTGVPLPRTESQQIRLGDAVLQSVETIPPIRPQTVVACSVTTYAGRLNFACHWDARVLTTQQSHEFIQLCRDAMLQSIQMAAETTKQAEKKEKTFETPQIGPSWAS